MCKMKNIFTIAKKEIASTFASPLAFVFLGTFLFVTLFVFFWVETFFSRNIADVRPLFAWLPILLIFLVAALTMRAWSEERRSGTIEFLLTLPVKTHELVLGKFLACMVLIGLSLLLTMGVPVTVSMMGSLDWGPVIGAYMAAILMAGAYASIGLFVSSKTDHQVVSLILTVVVCSVFYLVGAETVTDFFGYRAGEILKLFGAGSRFASIERGVIDLRDVYYYASIAAVFLTLNCFNLEYIKWAKGVRSVLHYRSFMMGGLIIANFILANFWLDRIPHLRLDFTSEQLYSLSPATRQVVAQLQEPLLLRGYFSAKTHPLLAPLVPQIRDTLQEYQVLGQGRVRTEFVDPRENEELEAEANQKFNIKPIPFQFSDRYQAEVVNSYFNVVVQYGDQFEVLDFEDLIEVQATSPSDLKVRLKNLEYDLTRSIKRVLKGFQGLDHLFAGLKNPIKFEAYVSSQNLPPDLQTFKTVVEETLKKLSGEAGNKFSYEFFDPLQDPIVAKKIAEEYGFQPMVLNPFEQRSFYFYMVLRDEESVYGVQIPPSLNQVGLQKNVEAVLKRFSPGFIKTVGLVRPPVPEPENPLFQQIQGLQKYQMIEEKLVQNYEIKNLDLADGLVQGDINVLIIVSPLTWDQKKVFAMDQYLMQGGSVVLMTSPFNVVQNRQGISAQKIDTGLEPWLTHHGLAVDPTMVLDPQNASFPVAINRNLGGINVQEIRMVNYPYSVDVRGQQLSQKTPMTSGLPQVTFYYASPIHLDEKINAERKITPLLKSSEQAWTSDSLVLEPDFAGNPEFGFTPGNERASHLLGVLIEGSFTSLFGSKPSPLVQDNSDSKNVYSGVIDKSPESARLLLFASNEFIADPMLRLSQASGSSHFENNLQLVENAVDWAVEDRILLSIRSRNLFARTLKPMDRDGRFFWEMCNYVFAVLGLCAVYAVSYGLNRKRLDIFKNVYQAH